MPAKKAPALIVVKPARYLAITGKGQAGGAALVQDIGALYGVVYTTKMASKFAGRDYKVAKLEGLWWGPDEYPVSDPKTPRTWNWTLLVRTPDFVTPKHVRDAIALVTKKKLRAGELALARQFRRVKLQRLAEGRCVQILHVGPYDAEAPTIESMKTFACAHGLKLRGRHHEIYLSDPRRTAPAKLKTILRHPVG